MNLATTSGDKLTGKEGKYDSETFVFEKFNPTGRSLFIGPGSLSRLKYELGLDLKSSYIHDLCNIPNIVVMVNEQLSQLLITYNSKSIVINFKYLPNHIVQVIMDKGFTKEESFQIAQLLTQERIDELISSEPHHLVPGYIANNHDNENDQFEFDFVDLSLQEFINKYLVINQVTCFHAVVKDKLKATEQELAALYSYQQLSCDSIMKIIEARSEGSNLVIDPSLDRHSIESNCGYTCTISFRGKIYPCNVICQTQKKALHLAVGFALRTMFLERSKSPFSVCFKNSNKV